eukprot:TRINITY_DN3781_c0_g1_i4.p2 TRINITY_DN3781_c0_g1~~TRINITY_DN3781_c0_g1_i4.p2  ORF type:complete len:118 (-),score=16.83 TRINITY_DN3781_c0_g1_i4:113-466(-)
MDSCFLIFEKDTYARVKDWMLELDRYAYAHIRRVIVCNKMDLPADQHVVSRDEAREYAEGLDIPFFEVSARDALRVEDPFLYLAKILHDDDIKREEDSQREANNRRAQTRKSNCVMM